jgi:hypothetical protein
MSTSTYPDLCEDLRELAAWTRSTLGKADRLRMAYNEETITETLLLTLAERHAGRGLSIRAYTKHEEGTGTKATSGKPTGADWSFWFANTHNLGIELRIQAKRLFSSGKYDSLDGTGKQIKDLQKNCGSAIPLYVFYNNTSEVWLEHLLESFCCLSGFPRDTDWGCTYAPLISIPNKLGPTPAEILHMRPWHTLVCGCTCPNCGSKLGKVAGTLPQRVAAAVEKAYANSLLKKKSKSKWVKDLSISSENSPPDWVRLLITGDAGAKVDGQEGRQTSEIDAYLNKHGLRGVVIVAEG